jgi:mono/diheme cytochrome c family protein
VSSNARTHVWVVVVTIFIVLFAVVLALNERSRTQLLWQAGFLPGNPQRGGELFYDRGCVECHSVTGVGGQRAPDLSRSTRAPSDLVEVAAAMWNHAPTMWEDMSTRGYQAPELTPRDATDLLAFLFVAGYLDEQGSPQRGRLALAQMGCRKCHATGESERQVGPDLALWSSNLSLIAWAQRFWNHAPRMERAMEAEGVAWPELASQQVADMLAYLRTVGTGFRQVAALPGDPWSGKSLFRERCQRCHTAEGEGGDVGPELDRRESTGSLSGFAAALWNHAPAMGERMKELGIDRPQFTEQEMADLITYFFAIRYFAARGDADVGAEVYLKHCSSCHGEAGEGGVGPSLRALGPRSSATFMTATLWNHGPRMYEEMRRQGREWPRFEANEMRDLIEYLRSL